MMMMMIKKKKSKITGSVLLLLLLVVTMTGNCVSGWSFQFPSTFFGRLIKGGSGQRQKQQSSSPPKTFVPPRASRITTNRRQTQSLDLVNHLVNNKGNGKSLSKLDKRLSIVELSSNGECGVKFNLTTKTTTTTVDDDDNNNNHHHQQQQKKKISVEETSEMLVEETEEIVWIDRNEFITPELGKETKLGQALTKYLSEHDDLFLKYRNVLSSLYIAIFLCLNNCKENKNKSIEDDTGGMSKKYNYYIDTLPSINELQHLPVYWDDTLLEELIGSPLYYDIHQRRSDWLDEYNLILNAAALSSSTSSTTTIDSRDGKLLPFDFDTWCWSRSIITSRGFTDNNNDYSSSSESTSSTSSCLVPFVDMINHCSSSSTHDDNEEEEEVDEDDNNKNAFADDDSNNNNNDDDDDDDIIKCTWEIQNDGFHLNMPTSTKITTKPSSSSRPTTTKQQQQQQDEDDDDDKRIRRACDDDDGKQQQLQQKTIEISYGTNSNAAFLLNYGFALLDDSHEQTCLESIVVSMKLLPTTRSIEDMWERDGLGGNNSYNTNSNNHERNITLSINNPNAIKTLLSLCRVSCCQNDTELLLMQKEFMKRGEKTTLTTTTNQKQKKTKTKTTTTTTLVPQMAATLCREPFSIQNEIYAMEKFLYIILDQLGKYKTSIVEDDDALSLLLDLDLDLLDTTTTDTTTCDDGNNNNATTTTTKKQRLDLRLLQQQQQQRKNNNRKNAIIVRRSEKRVLIHFCILAQYSLTYLYNHNNHNNNDDQQDQDQDQDDADDNENNNDDDNDTVVVDFDMYKGLLDATLTNQVPLN